METLSPERLDELREAHDLSAGATGVALRGPSDARVTLTAAPAAPNEAVSWRTDYAARQGESVTVSLGGLLFLKFSRGGSGGADQYVVGASHGQGGQSGYIAVGVPLIMFAAPGPFSGASVSVPRETVVFLKAWPKPGYFFDHWEARWADPDAPSGERAQPLGQNAWYSINGQVVSPPPPPGAFWAYKSTLLVYAQPGLPHFHAVFRKSERYALDATPSDPCAGYVAGDTQCTYAPGVEVALNANAYEECCYTFLHWQGEGNDINGNPVEGNANQTLRIAMHDDREVVAVMKNCTAAATKGVEVFHVEPFSFTAAGYAGDIFHSRITATAPGWNWNDPNIRIREHICYINDDFGPNGGPGLTEGDKERILASSRGTFEVFVPVP